MGTAYYINFLPPDTGAPGDVVSVELAYMVAMASLEEPDAGRDALDVVLVDESDPLWQSPMLVDRIASSGVRDEWFLRSKNVTEYFETRDGWTRAQLALLAVTDDSDSTSWWIDNIQLMVCTRLELP